MKFAKAAAVMVFFAATSVSLCAATITLAVVQKGAPQNEVLEASRIIENSIMDFYFDDGQIISNLPISSEWKDFDSAEFALVPAVDGGTSYLISVLIEYASVISQGTSVPLLTDIAAARWRVVRTSDGAVLGSGILKPESKKRENSATGIRDFARQIARETAVIVHKKYS